MKFTRTYMALIFVGSAWICSISCSGYGFAIHPTHSEKIPENIALEAISISSVEVKTTVESVEVPKIEEKSIFSTKKKLEVFHDLSQRCMKAIDNLLEFGENANNIVLSHNNETEEMDFAAIYRCLNAMQLSAQYPELKNELLEACMSFNRDKIASSLVNIYISLVTSEDYSVVTQIKGTDIIYKTFPCQVVQETQLSNFIKKMIKIDNIPNKVKSPIEKAIDFFMGDNKEKKSRSYIFEDFSKSLYSVKNDKNTFPLIQSQSICVFNGINAYNGCPFGIWAREMAIGLYNKKPVSIPWAYMDARIYANTSLDLDLCVLKSIVGNILYLTELSKDKNEFITEIAAVAPLITSFVEALIYYTTAYKKQLSNYKMPCELWCKARIFSIVQKHLKGELTLTILQTQLEIMLGDILYNLIRMKEVEITELNKRIVEEKVFENIEKFCMTGLLGQDLSFLDSNVNPYPIPNLIMNVFTEIKMVEENKICIFAPSTTVTI